MPIKDLFKTELKVVNFGLTSFKDSLDHAGARAVHVDWRPPVDVDPALLIIVKAKRAAACRRLSGSSARSTSSRA
jgi:hypothetical protein